jgi:hypothetical protein
VHVDDGVEAVEPLLRLTRLVSNPPPPLRVQSPEQKPDLQRLGSTLMPLEFLQA